MLGAFPLGAFYLGQSGGIASVGLLTVQDAVHGHSLDAVLLIQQHTLTVDELAQAHLLEGTLILVENKLLVIQDSAQAHGLDAIAITQAHLLALQDVFHGQVLDAVALAQIHVLALADALHAHGLEAVVVSAGTNLVVQDVLQGHLLETPSILIILRETPLPPDVINRLPYGRDDKIIPRGQVVQPHPGFAKKPTDLPLIKRVGDDKPLIKH